MIEPWNAHGFILSHPSQAMYERAPGVCIERVYCSASVVSVLRIREGVQLSSGVVEAVHRDECDLAGEKSVQFAQKGGAERPAGVELVRKQYDG